IVHWALSNISWWPCFWPCSSRARGSPSRTGRKIRSSAVPATRSFGFSGARVVTVRGILNATANYILTRMAGGLDYPAALNEAQARGYAEPDPSDDVEGHDVVAKARILAAVAFGQTIALDQVVGRGISGITSDAVQEAVRNARRLKLVATVRPLSVGTG